MQYRDYQLTEARRVNVIRFETDFLSENDEYSRFETYVVKETQEAIKNALCTKTKKSFLPASYPDSEKNSSLHSIASRLFIDSLLFHSGIKKLAIFNEMFMVHTELAWRRCGDAFARLLRTHLRSRANQVTTQLSS